MKIIDRILDEYYTNKLLNYLKESLTSKRFIKIIKKDDKNSNSIKLYYNFCNDKELKKDIYIMSLKKSESFINCIRNIDKIIEYAEKFIDERN